MAKTSSIEKNKRRAKLAKQYGPRRAKLRAIARDKNASMEERFAATLKLAELPRNSAKIRVRNRCDRFWLHSESEAASESVSVGGCEKCASTHA